MVLIAPAPDFTAALVEPSLTEAQKQDLEQKGYFEEPSEYSPNPYVYTRALIEDGRRNRSQGHYRDRLPGAYIAGNAGP